MISPDSTTQPNTPTTLALFSYDALEPDTRAVFTDFERTSINLLVPVNKVPHDRWQYNSDARYWEQAVAA